MIFEGSRYEEEVVLPVSTPVGVFPAIYTDPNFNVQEFEYDSYVTRDGDRYDLLASRIYGDPSLWWVLARANPEVFYPDDIPFGTVIRIPRANSVL